MYKQFIRPVLYRFDPEKIHYSTFRMMRVLRSLGLLKPFFGHKVNRDERLAREVFGIRFPNPVGLAAGFDKNAACYQELSQVGFGFIEIGTVTPKPQEGNPKKRLFRLVEDEAVINRMGFNNLGVEAAVKQLKKNKNNLLIGGNIGKNKDTPNARAVEDYLICFEALFPYVDYFVVNVSSPNTPNLRELQDKEPLTKLLLDLQAENNKKATPKPILLKIAPDLTDSQLLDIVSIVEATSIAGIIATNTTISRENLQSDAKKETGGLSGKPLRERSTEVIKLLYEKSGGSFPIIGVGGIHSAEDALEKLEAGASLIQLYTGFIYEGPRLIAAINKAILEK